MRVTRKEGKSAGVALTPEEYALLSSNEFLGDLRPIERFLVGLKGLREKVIGTIEKLVGWEPVAANAEGVENGIMVVVTSARESGTTRYAIVAIADTPPTLLFGLIEQGEGFVMKEESC